MARVQESEVRPNILYRVLERIAYHVGRSIIGFAVYRLPNGAHVTRYSMYAALKGVCDDGTRGRGKRVLCISHSKALAATVGLGDAELIEANFPEHNITDLSAFANASFDAVVSDQVLEHIEGDPRRAFDESLRLLKPGGLAVHTTCFINPIHADPSDFWRFTPIGLRNLASGFSQVLLADGWGNRGVWFVDWLDLRTMPVPHAKWHPLHQIAVTNNETWPAITWIVARK